MEATTTEKTATEHIELHNGAWWVRLTARLGENFVETELFALERDNL